ncbi:tetratricopeptide repeat protein [candidate division WOR-3 bacterium]|nr:tetratricopeptide repeat protein [candidate division WOR-3 bacterium]
MAEKSPSPEIIKLQKKFDSEPDSLIFARLADAYLSEDLAEKALEIAEKGVSKHPEYISGLMVLGKCFEKNGEEIKALDTYLKVLDRDKENLLALQKVGKGAYKTGKYEKALESYKKLLALTPFDESLQQIVNEIEDIVKKQNVREQMRTKMEKAGEENRETKQNAKDKKEDTDSDLEIFEEAIMGAEEAYKDQDLEIELPIEKTLQIEDIFGEEEPEEKRTGLPGDSVMDQLEDDVSLELEVEMLEKQLEESIDQGMEEKNNEEIQTEKENKPFPEEQNGEISDLQVQHGANVEEYSETGEEVKEDEVKLYEGEIESITMAKIYEKQGNYSKALSIFEKLLPDNPELNEDIERLKKLLEPEKEEEKYDETAPEDNEAEFPVQSPEENEMLNAVEKEELTEQPEREEVPAKDDEGLLFDQVASETLEELKKIEKHMSILSPDDNGKKDKKEEKSGDSAKKSEYEYNQRGLEAFKNWLDKIE